MVRIFLFVMFIFVEAILFAQNVGIGIDPPVYRLDVTTSLANDRVINALHTGASGTNYGLYSSLTGAATTNVAGYFSATGATNKYAIIIPTGGGRVGLGTTTPDASSVLDMTSGTNGMLIPRMSRAQMNAIASPAAGLMVCVIDPFIPSKDFRDGLFYYNGSDWVSIYLPIVKIKDPTTSSTTTTLANDANLSLTLGANEIYRIEGMLSVTGDASGDIKFAFVESSTLEISINSFMMSDDGAMTDLGLITESYNTGGLVGELVASGENHIYFKGIVMGGASGGTMNLQWARNAASFTPTSVIENHSYMLCTKIN